MSENIEIEFKNLLTKEEFDKFLSFFQLKETDFVKQENHYFDTSDFALKEKSCALRLRQKKNIWEMTLKQPHEKGLLETNQVITEEEAQSMLNGSTLIDGEINTKIKQMGLAPEAFIYFGSLVTDRIEIPYRSGLLVLDKSYYLSTSDYEVEYEVTNKEEGRLIFIELLKELHIPSRKTKNKVQRFYNRKKKLEERGE